MGWRKSRGRYSLTRMVEHSLDSGEQQALFVPPRALRSTRTLLPFPCCLGRKRRPCRTGAPCASTAEIHLFMSDSVSIAPATFEQFGLHKALMRGIHVAGFATPGQFRSKPFPLASAAVTYSAWLRPAPARRRPSHSPCSTGSSENAVRVCALWCSLRPGNSPAKSRKKSGPWLSSPASR